MREDVLEQQFSFGETDRLGREIGSRVTTWTGTRFDRPYFGLKTQATRNGKQHQAFNIKSFSTAEARDKAAEKYVANARKRAQQPAARERA